MTKLELETVLKELDFVLNDLLRCNHVGHKDIFPVTLDEDISYVDSCDLHTYQYPPIEMRNNLELLHKRHQLKQKLCN